MPRFAALPFLIMNNHKAISAVNGVGDVCGKSKVPSDIGSSVMPSYAHDDYIARPAHAHMSIAHSQEFNYSMSSLDVCSKKSNSPYASRSSLTALPCWRDIAGPVPTEPAKRPWPWGRFLLARQNNDEQRHLRLPLTQVETQLKESGYRLNQGQLPNQPTALLKNPVPFRGTVAWACSSCSKKYQAHTHWRAKNHGRWDKLVGEFRKNYCPRRSPSLVLPGPPTDAEKDLYVEMKRPILAICNGTSLIAVAVGGIMLAKRSPIFVWYGLFVFGSLLYLFTSLFITLFGREFDLMEHERLLEESPVTDDAPTMDVYLPVCKEPLAILENTWRCIAGLQYPEKKKAIYVLDDGADKDVESLALRFGFNYICRPTRELKKAGNIRYAFARTHGDFFAIFDADFCPRSDFLLHSMPYHLTNDRRAILQTPQFFRTTKEQTWVEQGAGSVQEFTFRIMQTSRDRWGAAMCVGSNAIYRRAALEPISGAYPDDYAEDIKTGVWAMTQGWSIKYIPLVLACGMCPDTPSSLFSQQSRWCTGTIGLVATRAFWKSTLSAQQKLCYVMQFMHYSMFAVVPVLIPILAPLIVWTTPSLAYWYSLSFGLPGLLYEVIAVRIWARCWYNLSVQYVQIIQYYASLHAIWDYILGKQLSWMPSGVGKVHKNHRYRNIRVFAWAWNVASFGALMSAVIYRTAGGMKWYNPVSVLAINCFTLLCLHRFLLYRHPRD